MPGDARRWLWAAPILGAGLVVGLLIAVFQAATQIQEASLVFVPKLLAMGAAVAIIGPWALETLVGLTQNLIAQLAMLGPGAM